jgi:hypothetical protein
VRWANFLITEVRAGVFSIRQVSPDETPGRADSISHVVKKTDIPDDVRAELIAGNLARYPNLTEPPPVIPWGELFH